MKQDRRPSYREGKERLLLVRRRGTSWLPQPNGKLKAGETEFRPCDANSARRSALS